MKIWSFLLTNLLNGIIAIMLLIGGYKLFDLGTFLVKKRKARNGRNPKTGEIIKIKAKMVPVFRPARALREAVKDVH
jgi:DNA-binding protein HU-beta